MMSDNALIEKLLNLPEFKVTDFKHNDNNMVFEVETKERPKVCPKCGVYKANMVIYKTPTKRQEIRDINNQGKRVALRLLRRHYRCKECGAHFPEPLQSVYEHGRMTIRLRDYIADKAAPLSFVEIEREYNISSSTVETIFLERVAKLPALSQMVTPRILGIDEICLTREGGSRKRPWAVIANQGEGTVVEMLRGNSKELVVDAFRQFRSPRAVEAVTMDMWSGYRTAAQEVFPHAMVVIDKFHVLKMANDHMDYIRGKVGKTLPVPHSGQLRNERGVFLAREPRISDGGAELRDRWFEKNELLKKTYELKESFYRMYDCSSRIDAEKYFAEWERAIPEEEDFNGFRMLAETVKHKKHKEHIFNYFDIPVTNATLEGINSAIRVISAQGRGYSFEVMRGKVLLTIGRRREVVKTDFDGCLFTTFDMRIQLPKVRDYGIPFEAILRAAEAGAYE